MSARAWVAAGGLPMRCLEGVLWCTAAAAVCFCCSTEVRVLAAQRESQRLVASASASAEREVERDAATASSPGTLLGRMDIAALGLSVPMLEDDDAGTLRRGAGHVPGTAMPGGLGNLVLAAHRDTFFRPLRKVRPGMVMEVSTPAGHWWYSIRSTEIVTPDRVDLLGIGDQPEMTLVTCYPFDYIGAAPKRLLVHGVLLSVAPAP